MSVEKVVTFSIGKGLEKEWRRFERVHGEDGRKIVEYLQARFTSIAPALGTAIREHAKSPDANVRNEAVKSMITLAATEQELFRKALEIALVRGKELPRSISLLKRYVAVFDEHIAAAERELLRTTPPIS